MKQHTAARVMIQADEVECGMQFETAGSSIQADAEAPKPVVQYQQQQQRQQYTAMQLLQMTQMQQQM